MSEVIDVTESSQLREIIENNDVVVVDFSAPAWCAPCQQFAPRFEEAAAAASVKSDARYAFVAVDVDKAPWAMVLYSVKSVPTVMLYRRGEFVGYLQSRTAPALLNEIKE